MLQIKNTLGGGKPEGLYAWKKYEVIPPTIVTDPSFKHYGDSSYGRIYIISPNFDVNAIDDWVSFFDGFSVNGEGNYYIFSKSGNTLRVRSSSTASYVSVTDFVISSGSSDYGDYVAYFTLASSLSYSIKTNKYIGDKEITQLKTGNFIDYIVSDKETAYPDDGEKGGFYYERVAENNLSVMVKRATETIVFDNLTFASDTSSYEIGYSDVKAVMVCQLSSEVSQYAHAQAFDYVRQNEDTGSSVYVYSSYYNSSGTLQQGYISSSSLMNGSAISFGFKAGWTYKIIIWR